MLDDDGMEEYYKALEKDQGIDPKMEYPPLPRKLFAEMVRLKVVKLPVTPEQDTGLKMMQWIWKDKHHVFIRSFLSSLKPKQREALAEMPRLSSLERGIVTMFMGEGVEEEDNGEKKVKKAPSISDVQQMVKHTAKQTLSVNKLKQLRQIAYDYKRKRASTKNRDLLAGQQKDIADSIKEKTAISKRLEKGISSAYRDGLSVMEIARLTGVEVTQIHDVLMALKAIKPMQKKEEKDLDAWAQLEIDWSGVFSVNSLSFFLWCQGWCINPSDVAGVVLGKDAVTTKHYKKIETAIERDMPGKYSSVFKKKPIHIIHTPKIMKQSEFSIFWYPTEKRYAALANDLIGEDGKAISGYGETASEAMVSTELLSVECIQINNLKAGVDTMKSWG